MPWQPGCTKLTPHTEHKSNLGNTQPGNKWCHSNQCVQNLHLTHNT